MKTACIARNRTRNRLLHCCIALLSLFLTQCDWTSYFLRCPDSGANCDLGSLGAGGSDLEQDMSPDLSMHNTSPPRTFEWRTAIRLDPSKMKFVGMRETMPVFWAKDTGQNPRWEVFQTDLLQTEVGARINPASVSTMDFPKVDKISGLDFANTELLVSSRMFVRLPDRTPSISYLNSGNEVLEGAAFVDPKKYFRDPEVDRFAVSVKPTQSGATSAVLLRWGANQSMTLQSLAGGPTALVMGDLDGLNGAEAVLFLKGSDTRVVHLSAMGSSGTDDANLVAGLRGPLSMLGNKDTTAAALADLDRSGKRELIIAVHDRLYFIVHAGKDVASGVDQFRLWSMDGFHLNFDSKTGDSEVRSVSAVDLTGDRFPELVVETDKAVHFFWNKP